MITDVVSTSDGSGDIAMSSLYDELFERLRKFLFDNVYFGSAAKSEEGKSVQLIRLLFSHYSEKPQDMGPGAEQKIEKFGLMQTITDYIAGMTDRFAVKVFEDLYIPKGWKKY